VIHGQFKTIARCCLYIIYNISHYYYTCINIERVQISSMTDEQIDSMLSTTIGRSQGSGGETLKKDSKHISIKTPLELQVSILCSKIRKQPSSSENWVEAIFDNVESLLGKDKVFDR